MPETRWTHCFFLLCRLAVANIEAHLASPFVWRNNRHLS